jgi:hypothetical protein
MLDTLAAPDHRNPLAHNLSQKSADERGLANAGLSSDEDELTFTGEGSI